MRQSDGKRYADKTTCVHCQMLQLEHNHKKSHKIGRAESKLLHFLATKKTPVSFKEIASFAGVSGTRITILTDALVQKNYIKRFSKDDDRRVLYAQITEEGRIAAQKFRQKHIKLFDEILRELSDDELKELFASLEKWKGYLIAQLESKAMGKSKKK